MDNQQRRFHPLYTKIFLAPDGYCYWEDLRNTYDVRPQCRRVNGEIDRYGYQTYWLPKKAVDCDSTRVRIKAHRFLYEIYHQQLLEDRVVHHIDNNPLNNSFDNLLATSLGYNNRESNTGFNASSRYSKQTRYDVIRAFILNLDTSQFGVKNNTLVEAKRKGTWVREWNNVQRLGESRRAKWLETGELDESMI